MIAILINDNNDIANPGSWGEVGWILVSFLTHPLIQLPAVHTENASKKQTLNMACAYWHMGHDAVRFLIQSLPSTGELGCHIIPSAASVRFRGIRGGDGGH